MATATGVTASVVRGRGGGQAIYIIFPHGSVATCTVFSAWSVRPSPHTTEPLTGIAGIATGCYREAAA